MTLDVLLTSNKRKTESEGRRKKAWVFQILEPAFISGVLVFFYHEVFFFFLYVCLHKENVWMLGFKSGPPIAGRLFAAGYDAVWNMGSLVSLSYFLVHGRMLATMFFRFLLHAAAGLLWCYALALACHSCCFTCCLLNEFVIRICWEGKYLFAHWHFMFSSRKTADIVISCFYLLNSVRKGAHI